MSSPPWDFIAKLVCIGDSGTGKSSLTVRLCEGRFSTTHDVTIGVEFGSRIVPVGPPASDEIGINFDNTSLASTPSALSPSASFTGTINSHTANKNGKLTGDKSVPPSPGSLSGLPPPPTKPSEPPVQKRMKLSLWDTAGQETYKSITRSYFRGASGALLVFDITRPPTFASLTQWLQDLRQIAEERIVVILVGNKSDLVDSKGKEKDADNPDNDNADNENNKTQRVTREEAEEWCRQNNVVRYVETSAKSGENVERAFREVAERIYRNIQHGRYDLNDRRSGVKGYGASAGPGNGRVPRTVNLGVNDAMRRGNRGWTGGCC
ncbi:Secretion related GTPase SrgD [Trichophyton interdigitale]|nr:Secretion related GTPase SrgD [Trichophyton interdigitale]KAG5218753.1 Secretion related GTPase SrgD [Trichophyton interdigitale]KAG8207202.1 Secretion related GTPase SrgD [Trichophyton interdigitale]